MKKSFLALLASLAACSGGTGKVAVSTHVDGGAAGATALSATAPVTTTLAIGDRVALERARLVVRKVMLVESTEGAEGPILRWSPTVIDLAGADLDGGVEVVLEAEVPAGTYAGLAAQFHKLTPGEVVGDPAFAPLGHSIVLDLTVDGEPVQFVSDLTSVAVLPGSITVAEGETAHATVSIDPGGWFTGTGGVFLDPRLDESRSRIEWNIKGSIRGFQDDDLDGLP